MDFLDIYLLLEKGKYEEFTRSLEDYRTQLSLFEMIFLRVSYYAKQGDVNKANELLHENKSKLSREELQAITSKFLIFSIFSDEQHVVNTLIEESNQFWESFTPAGMVWKLIYSDFLSYSAIFNQINGKFDLAEEIYNRCLKFEEEFGINIRLGKLKNNLASLYLDVGDTISALSMSYDVKELWLKEKAEHPLSQVYGNISEIYSVKGDFESAIFYANQSKKLLDKSGSDFEKIMIRVYLIQFYFQLNEIDSAKNELEDTLTLISNNEHVSTNSMFARAYLPLIQFLVTIDLNRANLILSDFEKLSNNLPDQKVVQNRFNLAKAMINFQANRLHDKMKVHGVLRSIMDDEESDFPVKSLAMLYYCDFLLFEYRLIRDNNILNELEEQRSIIESWAITNRSDSLVLISKIIAIQLQLYRNNVNEAIKILVEGLVYSSERGNLRFYKFLTHLQSNLLTDNRQKLSDRNYDILTSLVRFEFFPIQPVKLDIESVILYDQFNELLLFNYKEYTSQLNIDVTKINQSKGKYYIEIIQDKYVLIKKEGGFPWIGLFFEGDIQKAINIITNHKDLISLHQNYYPDKTSYTDILQELRSKLGFDEQNQVESKIFTPTTEVSDLAQYKLLFNPYRLSIMNVIVRNFNLSRSSLEEIIGGNRGTFASHLTKLIEEGLIDSETQFINDQPRVIIHVNQTGLNYYRQFKELITDI